MLIKNGLLGFVALGFGVTLTTPVKADISGTIFRDHNLSGTQQLLEPGVEGLTVTAYNDSGSVTSAVTDSNGGYTLSITPAGKYRVEVSGTPAFLNPGTAINGSTQALVSVVDNGAVHDLGLNNAGEYCQANPDIILARNTKEEHTGANSNISTLIKYAYTSNGNDAPTDITTYADVGSTYGVAHFRKTKATYVSSYFKRHSDLGPEGVDAIYKIDSSNAVSTFADLGGADPRGSLVGYDWNHDTSAYADVGKVGFGDIEISDDETKLFAVNMEDRKLYVFDLDENGDQTATSSFNIPRHCAVSGDSRPMGLGFNDGMLYVGITCTAESTVNADHADDSYFGPRKGDSTELSAHVFSFNPNTASFGAAPVVDIPLDYQRGCIYHGNISAADPSLAPPAGCAYIPDQDGVPRHFVSNWLPWQMDYDIVFNDKKPGNVGNAPVTIEYPQPLLSDIEFDNGAMIIQIKDLNGDKTGFENFSPNPADNSPRKGNGMGDIIRACGNPQSGWTLESNGSCGNVTTGGADNHEGIGGGEYYWYDNGPGGNGSRNPFQTNGHADTAMGGLLQVAGHPDVITGVMDSHNFYDNGLIWFQNANGEIALDGVGDPKRLRVSDNGTAFFGKANGLGDLEALCDPAPIEIGNYVWEDSNANGVQDPSETVLPNVTVELYEGATLVGTTVTDANGEYYFGGVTNTNMVGGLPIKTLTDYQIRIDLSEPDLGGRVTTLKDNNSNNSDTFDSDGDNGVLNSGYSTIAYTTGNTGQNNHTLDFGFSRTVSIGNRVWIEDDYDGDATTGNVPYDFTGVIVTATASDGVTTYTGVLDAAGNYSIDVPINGTYVVTVDTPAGYVPTNGSNDNAVPDDGTENDMSHNSNGTTVIVGDTNNNPTIDFGFIHKSSPLLPPPTAVPTLSEWTMFLLMMMLGLIGYQQGLIRKS